MAIFLQQQILAAFSKFRALKFLYSVIRSPCGKLGWPMIGISGDSFVVRDAEFTALVLCKSVFPIRGWHFNCWGRES